MGKIRVFSVGVLTGLAFFMFASTGLAGGSFFIDDVTSFVGIGNTTPASRLDVSGAMYSRLVTASSTSINWNQGNVQTMTLSSSPTLTFSNAQAGGQYTLILKQDGTGGRTVTWPGNVQWPGGTTPVLTSASNSIDLIQFTYDGSNYLSSLSLNQAQAVPITFDFATGTVDASGSASSVSWNHTVSGSNRALVVFVYNDDGSDKVTSVTYNGTSMTRVAVRSEPGKQTVYAYLLLNPSLGTHAVVVTASGGSNQLGGVSMSYTGVKQSSQPDSYSSGGGTAGSTFTLNTTVVAPNSWVIGAERNDTGVPTVGSGTVLRGGINTMQGVDKDSAVGAGSQSLIWNSTPGAVYTGVIVSLSPAQ